MIETKRKILDAAEKLFAERGYASTSLRAVIRAAGVNLAAVHYHFGSKEALYEAVVVRRVGPVNEERLRLLDCAERDAGDAPPALERLLEAFVFPPFQVAKDPKRGGATLVRMIGRMLVEGEMPPGVLGNFAPVVVKFLALLRRAVPGLTQEELLWRTHFSIGALAHSLRGAPELEALSGESLKGEGLEHRLVAFLAAGFRG